MSQPNVFALDQALLDASMELIRANQDKPRNPERVEAARQSLDAAYAARHPDA